NAKGRNLGGSRSPPLNSTVFCRIWGRQGGGRTFQQPLSAPVQSALHLAVGGVRYFGCLKPYWQTTTEVHCIWKTRCTSV
ncbi:MAG: hypothetical protein DRI56_10985, partial [Chloroflexota bacterium]